MRRILAIMAAALLLVSAGPPVGQRISTRSEKLSDFRLKVTKVVLTGNAFQDVALKEAVRNAWTITPYEFCSPEEFETLKTSGDYYFMLRTTDPSKPGISFLTVVKGGAKDVHNMLEVFSMPVGSEGARGGSEEFFLTALMGMMQENVEKGLDRAGVKLKSIAGGSGRLSKMKLYINSEDLAPQVDETFKAEGLGKDMYIIDPYGAEDIIMSGAYDTAVSYVIAPEPPSKGSVCYKMLIDARTHELLWLGKHTVRPGKKDAGFLKSDLRKFSSHRK